jgi:transglutaminase-like putative cysteine protease
VVSTRKILAAISLLIILWLILSLILPPLLTGLIIRHLPYEDVPDWGSGVTVGSEDNLLTNITLDELDFININWSLNPMMIFANITPADPPRYWRRNAYDTYTGSQWQRSSSNTQPLSEVDPGSEVVYTITQNISHQLGGTLPLLALWPNPMIIRDSIYSERLPSSDSYTLEVDDYGTALLRARFSTNGSSTIQYQVTYNPVDWRLVRPQSQSASLTPSSLNYYQTQGLNQLSDPTRNDIQNRLSSILAGVPDNAFEQAFSILEYFKGTFAFNYSLSRPAASQDLVEYFLTQGGGIGLNFATAYTMFLREQGIAARPVLGVILGENHTTHRVLRMYHFHFWVEVYIPTSATEGYWLQFDPTPLPSEITDGIPLPTRSLIQRLTSKAPQQARDQDDFVISTYYELTVNVPIPIVDRGQLFQIEATLTKDGVPESNEVIWFYDDTEQWLLGSDTTSSSGYASTTFTYNNSAIVGFHILRVAFHARSEYGIIALRGAANLTLAVTPDEVNRTYSIAFDGFLRDAVNGRGLSQNETFLTGVNLLLNFQPVTDAIPQTNGYYAGTYRIPANQTPLGPFTVAVSAFALPSIINPIISSPVILNITAQSQLTVTAVPNAVRRNSNISISGRLTYENSTVLQGQIIEVYWNDTHIGNTVTDSIGNFLLNHTPAVIGTAIIRVRFAGSLYVFGSTATTTAQVHDQGTIAVFIDDDDGDDVTQRGLTVNLYGWVENDSGIRQADVSVLIYFNTSQLVQTTTFANGSFRTQYQLQSTQSIGLIEVTGDVVSAILVVVSTIDYITINSTTQILNLQIDKTRAMIGEQVSLTGRLIDDQGAGISGRDITINLDYLSTTTSLGTSTTIGDGTFQVSFTVPGSIPSSLPTVSLVTSYSGTNYLSQSNASRTLDIFANATLNLTPLPSPQLEGSSIIITGTFFDDFSRPLSDREVTLLIDGQPVISANTSLQGQVSFNYTIPILYINRNLTFQLQHQTVRLVNSNIRNIVVEAASMQQPIPLPIEIVIIIIVIVVVIIVAVMLYRYLKKRPRRPQVPSIDAAAMLTTLRQLLTDKKYRESVIYAFRMFETLVQVKLGLFRDPSITLREFGNLAVAQGRLDTRSMELFIRGVEEARFSDHRIRYKAALSTLNAFASIYNALVGGNLRFVTQEQEQQQSE